MTRCGFITLLGAPNAGKSTLLNALVGQKVAIVTPKAQTTRGPMLGIRMEGEAQLVFVDTPGVFRAKGGFEKAMVEAAWAKAGEADAVLYVIDASRTKPETEELLLAGLPDIGARRYLVLNKIDATPKPQLLELAARLNAALPFEGTFMVSATRGHGIDDVVRTLSEGLPQGPWLYPEDFATDTSERQIAAEITREQLFLRLRQELPYSLTVETESWEEKPDGSVRIQQVITVERESQKKILLGSKGETIKALGTASRAQIARALGITPHLFLFVRVREGWKDDAEVRRHYGI